MHSLLLLVMASQKGTESTIGPISGRAPPFHPTIIYAHSRKLSAPSRSSHSLSLSRSLSCSWAPAPVHPKGGQLQAKAPLVPLEREAIEPDEFRWFGEGEERRQLRSETRPSSSQAP